MGLLLTAAVAAALTACQAPAEKKGENSPTGSESAQTESQKTDEAVKLTLSTQPAPHSLPIFVGIEKGWFEEEGLDIDVLTYISGPPQMEAVASNAWQLGVSGITAAITGVSSYDLSVMGFSVWDYPSQRLFVREDSEVYQAGAGHISDYPEIYGTADIWKGKKILCTKGTLGHLQLLATLKAIGLTENDVDVVHMEIPAAYQAFKAGEADALVTWSTYTLEAEKEGWKEVSSAEKAGLLVPSAILANQDVLQDNPEAAQKVMNVVVRGMQWVNENKAEASELYFKICQQEGVNATLDFCKETMDQHNAPTIEEMEAMLSDGGYEKNLENVMDFYIEQGTYTAQDKEKVVSAFDGEMLKNAIEAYKNQK